MKKNIITLFSFAVIMAFTMPATVYADNTMITNESPDPKTATMNVSYTVEPSYTVTIPASVTIGGEATVSAKDICIEKGKTLKVTLSGAQAQNETSGLKVSAGADKGSPVLDYKITKDSDSIGVDSEIISTTAGTDATANLTFNLSGKYTYSGTYNGTITFTVSVEWN